MSELTLPVVAVISLLVLAAAAVRLARPTRGGWRFPGSGRGRAGDLPSLECAGVVRLTQNHSLHLVRWGSRCWLVSCYPGGTQSLAELSAEPGPRAPGEALATPAGLAGSGRGGVR